MLSGDSLCPAGSKAEKNPFFNYGYSFLGLSSYLGQGMLNRSVVQTPRVISVVMARRRGSGHWVRVASKEIPPTHTRDTLSGHLGGVQECLTVFDIFPGKMPGPSCSWRIFLPLQHNLGYISTSLSDPCDQRAGSSSVSRSRSVDEQDVCQMCTRGS
jgi:hypothetical protein